MAAARAALTEVGRPFVIENVMAAPLDKKRSIVLCGGMFGLRTYRHRRFESSVPLVPPEHPATSSAPRPGSGASAGPKAGTSR
ncbi:hypothetical protein [Nocardia sp. NPDC004260]